MMMNRLFNSPFENSLRVLLLLDKFENAQNLDMIYATDFMVSYGATFGAGQSDLNGDNPYKFSEFASRRNIVREALRQLVLDGLVIPIQSDTSIVYTLSEAGVTYSRSLDSEYACEYRKVSGQIIERISDNSERNIIDRINKMSAMSLRKGDKK
jgi:hypothetical protein